MISSIALSLYWLNKMISEERNDFEISKIIEKIIPCS